MKYLIIAIITIIACAFWFRAVDARATPATHAECVAYWTTRTASWTNQPTINKIHNDPTFCGGIAK